MSRSTSAERAHWLVAGIFSSRDQSRKAYRFGYPPRANAGPLQGVKTIP